MTIRPTRPLATLPSLVAGLVLALAGAAAAQDPAAEADPRGKYFWVDTATVVDVDAEAGRLTVNSREIDTTYRVEEGTLIRRGGETIPLSSLTAGDRVAISAHAGQDVDDALVADTVQVVVIDPATGEPRTREAAQGR